MDLCNLSNYGMPGNSAHRTHRLFTEPGAAHYLFFICNQVYYAKWGHHHLNSTIQGSCIRFKG